MGCVVGRRQDQLGLPLPSLGHPIHMQPLKTTQPEPALFHVPRPCSLGAGEQQVCARCHLAPAREDGRPGQWVWHTQYCHQVPKTSSHLLSHPSSDTANPCVPKHCQAAAWSPVPKGPLHPLSSCSMWQVRDACGSAGERMGIWGCSFANSHCKPQQDSSCLSCSASSGYCLASAILLECPRYSLRPGISAGQCSHTPGCLSPPAQCRVPSCNSWLTDSCTSSPGQQSPSALRSR